jgi:hypothetical protein
MYFVNEIYLSYCLSEKILVLHIRFVILTVSITNFQLYLYVCVIHSNRFVISKSCTYRN